MLQPVGGSGKSSIDLRRGRSDMRHFSSSGSGVIHERHEFFFILFGAVHGDDGSRLVDDVSYGKTTLLCRRL